MIKTKEKENKQFQNFYSSEKKTLEMFILPYIYIYICYYVLKFIDVEQSNPLWDCFKNKSEWIKLSRHNVKTNLENKNPNKLKNTVRLIRQYLTSGTNL